MQTANHWQESEIEVSNFEAWLAASPLGSARQHHHSNGATTPAEIVTPISNSTSTGANVFGHFATSNISATPAPWMSSNTTPVTEQMDYGAFDFLQPPELFISLPIPKDFKLPSYNATPRNDIGFTSPAQYENTSNANNSDMMLFISPKAMTFSQGFGLEPQSATGTGYGSKNFPFGLIPSMESTAAPSPMFSTMSKLDMSMDYGQDEDFAQKSSQLEMLHQPIAPQLHHYHSAIASSTSFSLNNHHHQEDSSNDAGNDENVAPTGKFQRAHSVEDVSSSSGSGPSRISEIASSCHHCKRRRHPNELRPCHRNGTKIDRNGTETVASRRTCRKRYCLGCLQKYGISFAEAEQAGWTCMACRGQCECAACRRKGQ